MRHYWLIGVMVLAAWGTPTLAFAQDTRTTLLSSARRQGTTESGGIVLPTSGSRFIIEIPIATADYEDEANALCFTLRYFVASTQEWKTHGRSCWGGGHYVDRRGEVNPPPREFLDPAQWGGVEIRVEIDHLQFMRAGIDLVTLP